MRCLFGQCRGIGCRAPRHALASDCVPLQRQRATMRLWCQSTKWARVAGLPNSQAGSPGSRPGDWSRADEETGLRCERAAERGAGIRRKRAAVLPWRPSWVKTDASPPSGDAARGPLHQVGQLGFLGKDTWSDNPEGLTPYNARCLDVTCFCERGETVCPLLSSYRLPIIRIQCVCSSQNWEALSRKSAE